VIGGSPIGAYDTSATTAARAAPHELERRGAKATRSSSSSVLSDPSPARPASLHRYRACSAKRHQHGDRTTVRRQHVNVLAASRQANRSSHRVSGTARSSAVLQTRIVQLRRPASIESSVGRGQTARHLWKTCYELPPKKRTKCGSFRNSRYRIRCRKLKEELQRLFLRPAAEPEAVHWVGATSSATLVEERRLRACPKIARRRGRGRL
jgi:hypothetical protein